MLDMTDSNTSQTSPFRCCCRCWCNDGGDDDDSCAGHDDDGDNDGDGDGDGDGGESCAECVGSLALGDERCH